MFSSSETHNTITNFANHLPGPAAQQTRLAAQMPAVAKKQGKEKKPDENLVSLVFPD
jgi:hypothetical protein